MKLESKTIIAQAHARYRRLWKAFCEELPMLDDGPQKDAINFEMDELSRMVMRTAEEEPNDCYLQADIALIGVENVMDGWKGMIDSL